MCLWSKATKWHDHKALTYECVLKWQLHIECQCSWSKTYIEFNEHRCKNWSKGSIREKWTHALIFLKNSLVFQKSSCKMTQKCKWPQGHMEEKCSYCKRDWDQNEDENCWKMKEVERSTNHKNIHNNLSKEVGFFPWFPCWEYMNWRVGRKTIICMGVCQLVAMRPKEMDKIRCKKCDCAKRWSKARNGGQLWWDGKRIIILRAEEVHSNNSHPLQNLLNFFCF